MTSTTPTIRTVDQLDAAGSRYAGPALLGARHVTVCPGRYTEPVSGRVYAATSDGWHVTRALRAVDPTPTP